MIKSVQFLVVLLPVLAGTNHGGEPCPRAPSMMTAEQACSAVCGTRHMHRLCLRTLLPPRPRHGAAPAPVTHHAAVAARGPLDAYDATEAAARKAMLHSRSADAVPSDERVAYAGCVDGYEAARRSMGRVADDLELLAMASSSSSSSSSCAAAAAAARLARDYTGGLHGMDACRKSLLGFPASPLYGRNLADRNKTPLAALLYSLVPMPPGKRGAVHA